MSTHYEKPQPGWRMITRGLYVDENQDAHFFHGEFLEAHGIVDTPENRRAVEEALIEVVRKQFGDIPVHYTGERTA